MKTGKKTGRWKYAVPVLILVLILALLGLLWNNVNNTRTPRTKSTSTENGTAIRISWIGNLRSGVNIIKRECGICL